MGYRTSWKYDTDVDGDTDGSDLTFWFCYDDSWRVVATYRGSDSNPIAKLGQPLFGLSRFLKKFEAP